MNSRKSASDNVITIHHLRKYYDGHRGIEDVSLSVKAGTIHGFLGPNGAGKTTTIRILIGLLQPTSGEAFILGHKAGTLESKRLFGYIPSDFELYRHYTVKEYLDYLESLRGGAPRREELVERFVLDETRLTKELSRGNRQKVGIVQAFMHDPPLVIADEPTTGLDPLMQEEFAKLTREYVEQGKTIFLSSHILSEVQEICDVVSVIKDGLIVSSGDVDDLLSDVPRKAVIHFEKEPQLSELKSSLGIDHIIGDGNKITIYYNMPDQEFVKKISVLEHMTRIYLPLPSLEEYFLPIYQK